MRGSFKKYHLAGLVIFFLLLDWAALDDITTGNEPSYFLEYSILAISVLIFSLSLKGIWKKKVT